jgi:WhiB family redox-sensing transcriptional regulator
MPQELEDWRLGAVCAQVDPDLWFPEKGSTPHEAKAMCRRCPVTTECLNDALANDELFGVFGGLSAQERRKLKRQTAAVAA